MEAHSTIFRFLALSALSLALPMTALANGGKNSAGVKMHRNGSMQKPCAIDTRHAKALL